MKNLEYTVYINFRKVLVREFSPRNVTFIGKNISIICFTYCI